MFASSPSIASVGADPKLRDVPDEYLSEPWQMPEEVQRQAGCLIGEDYPEPIVDHRQAREEAFARYRG